MATNNNFFTISKAFGIILMVAGHSVCPDLLSRFIYLFHMPLFFFCSGYFFVKPTTSLVFKKFIFQRIKKTYLPFIKWSILFLIFHNLLYMLNIYNKDETSLYNYKDYAQKLSSILFTMSGQDPLIFQLWFLKQLLLSSVIICCCLYYCNIRGHKENLYLFSFTLILLTIITKSYNLAIPVIDDVSIVIFSATFFYFGTISKKYMYHIKYSLSKGGICFCLLLLTAWQLEYKIEMLNYSPHIVPFYICAALIGIYMTLCFAKFVESSHFLSKIYICKLLYYIGNHTMVILVWHLLAFKIGSFIKIIIWNYQLSRLPDYELIKENNTFFWAVYTIIGCGIPLLLSFVITRLKKLINRQ